METPARDIAGAEFALRGRSSAIRLDADGFHHPRTPKGRGFAYTRYADIYHLATSPRSLWIGTERSVYLVSRSAFVESDGPEHLVRVLLARVAQQPDGAGQLARMAEIEELARAPGSLRATWGLGIACVAVFLLELVLGGNVHEVGYFNATFVKDGDWWRLVTANLLHAFPAFPLHLILNLLGLAALGAIVERCAGTPRTLLVMGGSAIGSMVASGLAHYSEVVGVSGVVFGLLGATTWLEFSAGERLPAWWRIPRRALVAVLLLSIAMGFAPVIAGAAHLGGFLVGGLLMALLGARRVGPRAEPPWMRAAAAGVVAATVLAVVTAGLEIAAPGDYKARQIERIAGLPGISPMELNDRAWSVAVDDDSTLDHLASARLLAERAVEQTERQESALLDTLAELQFLLGESELAVQTINEAIALTPGDESDYYREQRRRFTGERDADDRPDPSSLWGPLFDRPAPEGPDVTV